MRWDRSFGGIYDDTLCCLEQMPDGGFILAGRSESPPEREQDHPNYGSSDRWVVRLDADGNKLWDWSTELEVWTTLQTNRMGSGSLEFQDPAGTNLSQRFYRARLVADTTDH